MKEPCCITLCQLFLKKDESLQKKAANFISKYGDVSSSNLQETLQSYQPEMFQSVQAILASFKPQSIEPQSTEPHLAKEANATDTGVTEDILHTEGKNTERNSTDENSTDNSLLSEEPSLEAIRICREDNRIPFPADKEDFLFQLSRLFDMEENWEIETTIAAIIAFHPQLDKEDLNRMEPISNGQPILLPIVGNHTKISLPLSYWNTNAYGHRQTTPIQEF